MAISRKLRREIYQHSLKTTRGKYRTTAKAIENSIADPKDTVRMTWGTAYSFNVLNREFKILEFKGSKKVAPIVPSWYRTVRTDTTDRIDTAKDSREVRDRW